MTSGFQYQGNLAQSFANSMFEWNTKAAICLLTDDPQAGTLRLDHQVEPKRTVRDVLKDKHPPGQPVSPEVIVDNDPPEIHPIVFDQFDASLIRSTALRTTGSAGPSGLDAACWRRLCAFFNAACNSLSHSLAVSAKRLCTDMVDPIAIAPLLSCRLITLNKCTGVRPIGIGDTVRRIIAKAILTITKADIQEATG